uniref:Protein AIR2,Poly(A) RNA polymerase protein 2 n=1 Tax=Saccharomyces cerevisiae (strain ATCC 204508 / S288c) TaxID=559292 RepID=UPI0004F236F2|nr:Chain B, Protein AIR2,Poly(A) RNA polymerase protein 2 [Saccharomyces cerevisiae S288C]
GAASMEKNTAPFVVDTAPTTPPDKLVAPSIEEVNSNPNELRALRGQGRYFGVSDDDKDAIKEAAPKHGDEKDLANNDDFISLSASSEDEQAEQEEEREKQELEIKKEKQKEILNTD